MIKIFCMIKPQNVLISEKIPFQVFRSLVTSSGFYILFDREQSTCNQIVYFSLTIFKCLGKFILFLVYISLVNLNFYFLMLQCLNHCYYIFMQILFKKVNFLFIFQGFWVNFWELKLLHWFWEIYSLNILCPPLNSELEWNWCWKISEIIHVTLWSSL